MTSDATEASNQQKQNRNEWISDFVAGWVSGAVSILACQPVDTILTRWQAVRPTIPSVLVASAADTIGGNLKNNINNSHYYTNWREMTLDLYRTSGPRALWRGASPVIVAAPLQNALLMGGYGFGSRYFTGDNDAESSSTSLSRSKQLGAIFVGGLTGGTSCLLLIIPTSSIHLVFLLISFASLCLANKRISKIGVLQSFLMSPVELIKVAQQCSGSKNGYQMISAAQNIVTNRTVMSGLNATLLRDGIPHGVWFVAYDVSKLTLMSYTTPQPFATVETVPVSVSLLSGAIAATVAWAVGYPADLIKTRIQAMSTTTSLGSGRYMGIVETAKQLIREADGHIWNGLYRGFGMKLVRSIPASMIGFTVYESVKEQILRLCETVYLKR